MIYLPGRVGAGACARTSIARRMTVSYVCPDCVLSTWILADATRVQDMQSRISGPAVACLYCVRATQPHEMKRNEAESGDNAIGNWSDLVLIDTLKIWQLLGSLGSCVFRYGVSCGCLDSFWTVSVVSPSHSTRTLCPGPGREAKRARIDGTLPC